MKLKSLGKATANKFLSANNRSVAIAGQRYLLRTTTLGGNILADAEPIPQGGQYISLFDRAPLSKTLRGLVEVGAYS